MICSRRKRLFRIQERRYPANRRKRWTRDRRPGYRPSSRRTMRQRADTSNRMRTALARHISMTDTVGENTTQNAKRLYINCDGDGSNSSRRWICKYQLQLLANKTGLEIEVSHLPPGTSKWNKIEHRLFCYIAKNWQGQPLIDTGLRFQRSRMGL